MTTGSPSSTPPRAKVPLAEQRDVLFALTHGWRRKDFSPGVDQVAPLRCAEITINEDEMNALQATHWIMCRLAECPVEKVQRFLSSGGTRI